MEASNYLFVYGTLLSEENEFAFLLTQNSSFYCKAKFKGRLYDIGEYPGAILQHGSECFVYGQIFLIDNPGSILKRIDNYEGFGEDGPQPNEFTRELLEVETGEGSLKCWAYLYNLPVDGLWQIKSGDYLEYIKV
jgi:gamma-glutamylcyclotransferase (GGCT)/AIG2-like uncharacterized protein YtfP